MVLMTSASTVCVWGENHTRKGQSSWLKWEGSFVEASCQAFVERQRCTEAHWRIATDPSAESFVTYVKSEYHGCLVVVWILDRVTDCSAKESESLRFFFGEPEQNERKLMAKEVKCVGGHPNAAAVSPMRKLHRTLHASFCVGEWLYASTAMAEWLLFANMVWTNYWIALPKKWLSVEILHKNEAYP